MKKRLLATCIIGCMISTSFAADKQPINQIVAVVNDDVVTRTELNNAMTAAKAQIAQEHISAPPEKMLQKQVLDQLINKKLQLQIAKQAGIRVDDQDVNDSIAQVAEQNKISVTDLYEHLGQEGMSKTSYQNEIRDQMIIQKLQQQEVVSRINISPDEIESFMHSTAWKNNSTKEYRIDDLLVPISDSPTTNEITAARKHATEIASKLKSGADFQQVALTESNKGGLQGGDLGWRKLPEIPSAFADPIARMKTNDVAGPIQTANGFHVIHLAAIRAAESGENMSATRSQVEQLLMQRKFEEAMQNWVSRLRGQSFIETKIVA